MQEALATALQVQRLLDSIKRTISNYYSSQGNEDLEVNLAYLEALKERLAKKSGGPASKPSTTKPPKAARGVPGIQGTGTWQGRIGPPRAALYPVQEDIYPY